jgi:putative DNA primase/helicase
VPWVRGSRGELLGCASNAFLVFTKRKEWRDVLAFDEFAQRPIKRMPPPYERGVAGDWEAMDDSFSAFWIATRGGISKMSSMQAAEAAEMAARAAPFDPVRSYLESLQWDSVERLPSWLSAWLLRPLKSSRCS